MRLFPDPDSLVDAAVTSWDMVVGGGIADTRPTPSSIVEERPQCTVRRFHGPRPARSGLAPVLLIPPLAAPATCFDLHRGASVAGHLVGEGHPTYLVDYGPISFGDRRLGIEYWVEEVIPHAIRATSEHAGGAPVQTLGWSLGGIMSLLTVAADQELPVASVAMVGSPFDLDAVSLFGPFRELNKLTGGRVTTALYRTLGGAPAPLVSRAFQLTAFDRYLTRPAFLASNILDRDTIAHAEAVSQYMAHMTAYPGRTFGQLYHAFFRDNSLASGHVELRRGQTIDLAEVHQPVLTVSGMDDVLAPEEAVVAVIDLLPNAAEVRFKRAPGGHLGVLTGRHAKDTTWPMLDAWLGDTNAALAAARPQDEAASA